MSTFTGLSAGVALGALGYALLAPSATPQAKIAGSPPAPTIPCHQSYPNIPGQVLAENAKMVVQRFTFPPGQWEGVHAHPPTSFTFS